MNTNLATEMKNDFEKDLFKLIYNSGLRKTMENVRKHKNYRIVTSNTRRNYLVSEPIHHRTQ